MCPDPPISCGTRDVGGDGIPAQAWRLEIFLDCLLAHADQGLSFFLDERYRHRLEDTERQLRDRLLRLVADTTPAERDTVAWSRLAVNLGSLGLPRE